MRIDEDARLSVINQGLVVPAPESLIKRFERGATRAEGSGLGLAIVNKILQQIDATLVLNSPASGRQGRNCSTSRTRAAGRSRARPPR